MPLNYYNINPFLGEFVTSSGLNNSSSESTDDEGENAIPGCTTEGTAPGVEEVCPDYIELAGDRKILKSDYYSEKLSPLEEFAGFFPRTFVPATNMVSDAAPGIISHQTLAIIDTAKEIEVGVGYEWVPLVVGDNQIQIPAQIALYLDLAVNDTVTLSLENLLSSNSEVNNMVKGMLQTVAEKSPNMTYDT